MKCETKAAVIMLLFNHFLLLIISYLLSICYIQLLYDLIITEL